MGSIEPKKLALRIAWLAKSKKAKQVRILDMRPVSGFCDYFVISSGASLRQVAAIAQAIEEDLEKENLRPVARASYSDESGWLALDYLAVVAHVFYEPLRGFYSLERLWSDAKRVRVSRPR